MIMKIMRTCLIIAGMTWLLSAAHGETVTRTVNLPDDISRVYLNGSNELYLTQGEEEFVKLTAPEEKVSRIEARVKGRALYLGKEKNWNDNDWGFGTAEDDVSVRFDVQLKRIDAIRILGSGKAFTGDLVGDRLKIIMYGNGKAVTKSIKARDLKLEMSGSCDVRGDRIDAEKSDLTINGSGKIAFAQLNANELEIGISGSGKVNLEKLTAAELETVINGSGNLDLAGRARSQELQINGSGDYRATDLISDTAYVDVRGVGAVKLSVLTNLTAELMRGADLVYYGGPELEADISGHGSSRHAGAIPGN